MTMQVPLWKVGVLLLASWLIFAGPKGCTLPAIVSKPSLIIMLYEAEKGPLPPYALGAANEMTAAGLEVRPADDDELTGNGEVPAWLNPALGPGRAIMGSEQIDDALILLAGDRVLKAIKLPATKAAILEACK